VELKRILFNSHLKQAALSDDVKLLDRDFQSCSLFGIVDFVSLFAVRRRGWCRNVQASPRWRQKDVWRSPSETDFTTSFKWPRPTETTSHAGVSTVTRFAGSHDMDILHYTPVCKVA